MPRKQRFKPSRKPKPISTVQAQEGADPGSTGTQDHVAAHVSDGDRAELAPDARAPQYRDQSGPR
jgi:hypothetical protein